MDGRDEIPSRLAALAVLAGPAWALAAVVVVVLVSLPAIVHLVDVNPLDSFSFLASHSGSSVLPGTIAVDRDVGFTAQALGHRAALDWLHLQVPWWNPFEGLGSPLAAEMQSAAFFPPVLLMALPDGSLWFHLAMEATACLSAWFLVRELGLSRPLATVGGVMFGLCGTFDWLWHAPMNPVPFLPLMLLGAERIHRSRERDSGWVVLALGVALSVYAGFPEMAYLDGLFVAAWVVFRLCHAVLAARAGAPGRPGAAGRAARGALIRFGGRYALGLGVGVLLALPLLLPFAEYVHGAYVGLNGQGVGYQHLTTAALSTVGLPYLYGPIKAFPSTSVQLTQVWLEVGGFVTAAAIVLALVGLVGGRSQRGLRVFVAGAAVVMLLWAFGVEPFEKLTTVLPGMAGVNVERYSSPVWELACALLACFGVDALGSSRRARIGALAAGAATAAYGAVLLAGGPGTLAAMTISRASAARAYEVGSIAWAATTVVLLSVLGLFRERRLLKVSAGVLLILDAGAMAFVPQLSAPRAVTVDTAPVAYLSQHLGLGRFFSFWTYHSDYGSYFGNAQLDTSDLPVPGNWAREIETQLAPNVSPTLFEGRRVVDPEGPSAASEALTHLSAYEELDVRYFVLSANSRIFGRGPRYPDGLREVFDDGTVIILALPDPTPYFTTKGAHCTVSPSGYDQATVDCDAPGLLVRSGLYGQGWVASVNGRAAPVEDYEGLLTAVQVPAGRSEVAFSYAPPHIDAALAGFGLGALGLVGIPVARRLRRRRRRRGCPAPGPEPPPGDKRATGTEPRPLDERVGRRGDRRRRPPRTP